MLATCSWLTSVVDRSRRVGDYGWYGTTGETQGRQPMLKGPHHVSLSRDPTAISIFTEHSPVAEDAAPRSRPTTTYSTDVMSKCCSLSKTRSHSNEECKAKVTLSPLSFTVVNTEDHDLPLTASNHSISGKSTEPCSTTFLANVSHTTPSQEVKLLVNSGCAAHISDLGLIPDPGGHT